MIKIKSNPKQQEITQQYSLVKLIEFQLFQEWY